MNKPIIDQHTNPSAYIPLIVDRLKTIHPYKIILFGSLAYGEPKEDSDIDLLVVVNRDDFPKNYREKSDLYVETSRSIDEFHKQVSIDLIVHTKAMYRKFIELGSLFSQEIVKKGIVLYEVDDEGMVESGKG
ncbi:MAG: nucleotidyltransferase domain-containing protein [Candidatus Omnitrophota bacterium]